MPKKIPAKLTAGQKINFPPGVCGHVVGPNSFYHYSVAEWLKGDPAQPPPPSSRWGGRNCDWPHFFARDVISMPDKWEYPWFAAWDLAFHMIPFARLDPQFAKEQLILMLREWYTHPNGQDYPPMSLRLAM